MFVQAHNSNFDGTKWTDIKHNSYDRYKYPCSLCDKRYTTKGHLDQHMRLHTGHYKFYCDKCRKGFIIKRDHVEHMRAHQGLKYHCDYCSKPFSSQKGLTYHLSTHTRPYRFACELCNKGFNPKADYERHIQTHAQWVFSFFYTFSNKCQFVKLTLKFNTITTAFSH